MIGGLKIELTSAELKGGAAGRGVYQENRTLLGRSGGREVVFPEMIVLWLVMSSPTERIWIDAPGRL